jgi:hypothetical protein
VITRQPDFDVDLRLDHELDATVLLKLDHDGVESAGGTTVNGPAGMISAD